MSDPLLKKGERVIQNIIKRLLTIPIQKRISSFADIDFHTAKILCLRQDAIGDVLVSTPVFSLLKKHYPTIIVDVLLSNRNYCILENSAAIRKRWLFEKNILKLIPLIIRLREERYDVVIDLFDTSSTTSIIMSKVVRAKYTLGFQRDTEEYYSCNIERPSTKHTHIVDRTVQLVTAFNIDLSRENIALSYSPSRTSVALVKDYLRSEDMTKNNILGINISAGDEARFWGIEHYRKLLQSIGKHHQGYSMLLLYKPEDYERARRIIEGIEHIHLMPVTQSFDQFAAFVKQLSILITPDTAAVHLASVFNIPAVVLYIHADQSLRLWEPYHTDYEVVVTNDTTLATIPVAQVYEAFNRLIHRHNNIHA